jgi:hypothetical protein
MLSAGLLGPVRGSLNTSDWARLVDAKATRPKTAHRLKSVRSERRADRREVGWDLGGIPLDTMKLVNCS